ncbi:hypothetical protein C9439_06070 [archaeon SCG-AAA382B04]|nr:hypothetical protein C9439_06070 [archaeon SCG-AAA382B04]
MKVKLEIVEGDEKTSVEFTGDISKDRIINFIEAFDFPSTTPAKPSSGAPNFSKNQSKQRKSLQNISTDKFDELTIKERLKLFIYFEFREKWFTSKKVRKNYNRAYNEDIGLSTVSTYLSRMARDDFLVKKGNRVERQYKLSEEAKERGIDRIEQKARA